MSIKAITHYLDREDIKGNDKLCLIILADYANDDGACFPGQERISKRLSMTHSGARKLLYRLRDRHEIEIVSNAGIKTATGCTNKYLLKSFISESKGVPWGTVSPSGQSTKGVPRRTQGCPAEDSRVSPARDTDPSVLDPSVLDPSVVPPSAASDPEPTKPTTTEELHKHPAVKAYKEIFHRSMKRTQYPHVQHIDDIDKWTAVLTEWLLRSYNPTNLSGQLDWYRKGIPQSYKRKQSKDTSKREAWNEAPAYTPEQMIAAQAAAQRDIEEFRQMGF